MVKIGTPPKKSENLLESSVADVMMSLRSFRRRAMCLRMPMGCERSELKEKKRKRKKKQKRQFKSGL